jgi:hypothetical protein
MWFVWIMVIVVGLTAVTQFLEWASMSTEELLFEKKKRAVDKAKAEASHRRWVEKEEREAAEKKRRYEEEYEQLVREKRAALRATTVTQRNTRAYKAGVWLASLARQTPRP